jgi:DNA-directed RNA polymerase subunit RPC12/RpoP
MAEVTMPDYIYREPSLRYKALNIIIIISLAIAIIFGSFLVAPKVGYILFFLAVFGLIVVLIIFHNKNTAYLCKSCGYEFEISFWKDLVSAHTPGKKLLTCPQCSYKDYASEVIKGKNEK